MRQFTRFTATIVFVVFSASALANEQSYALALAWFQKTQVELEAVDGHISDLADRLATIKAKLKAAQDEVAADPECRTLECAEIAELARRMQAAVEAAQMSVSLAEIARQELTELADNQRPSLGEIGDMLGDADGNMFYADLVRRLSVLTANLAVSAYTGDAGSASTALAGVANGLVNFGIHSGADAVTGYSSATGASARDFIGGGQGSSYAGAFSEALASQMVEAGLLSSNASGQVLTMAHLNSPSFQSGLRSQGMGILAGAVVNAAFEAWIGPLREDLRSMVRNHQEALAQQAGYDLAVQFSAVALAETRKRRNKLLEMANEVSTIAGVCGAEASRNECAARREAALAALNNAYEGLVTPEEAAANASRDALEDLRRQWREAMDRSRQNHEQLRQARDDLAEAERLSANRDRIAELAASATDPKIRQRYADQLARLEALGDPADLRRKVQELESARNSAREEAEGLLPRIEEARQAFGETNREGIDAAGDAEIENMNAIRAAWGEYYDCLQSGITEAITAPVHNIGVIRQGLSQEVDPGFIFAGLRAALEQANAIATRVEFGTRPIEGAQCMPQDSASVDDETAPSVLPPMPVETGEPSQGSLSCPLNETALAARYHGLLDFAYETNYVAGEGWELVVGDNVSGFLQYVCPPQTLETLAVYTDGIAASQREAGGIPELTHAAASFNDMMAAGFRAIEAEIEAGVYDLPE